MPKLFEVTKINGMELGNRFVRSATWEGMAGEEGDCTPRLIDLVAQLAKGKIGLIISSYAYVLKEGKSRIGQLGIYKDELIKGLREMTDAVHNYDSKIVAQIVHPGLFSDIELTGQIPMAPSHVPNLIVSPHDEMSVKYIHAVSEAFGHAALRAKMAGFDGVQIHCAHGYFHSQFLSPAFNKRTDAYGGPLEHRVRPVLETLDSIRDAVGPDFPVLIKLNCMDYIDGGFTMEDSLKVADIVQNNAVDAIELSGGTFLSEDLIPARTSIFSEKNEAYFKKEAKEFKKILRIPLILVGGIRSFHIAEDLILDGYADYISMCRPFVREPELIQRWLEGDRRKSKCISDSLCRDAAFSGNGIYCVIDEKEKNN